MSPHWDRARPAPGRARSGIPDTWARLRAAWEHTPLPQQTLAGIVTGALAHRAWPVRLPGWTRPFGRASLGAGSALVAAAVRERGPGSLDEPGSLVTRGVHARSRNPMYLGATLAHVGLAGASRNAWMLATTPVSAALLHRTVPGEERLLRSRFGVEYDASGPRFRAGGGRSEPVPARLRRGAPASSLVPAADAVTTSRPPAPRGSPMMRTFGLGDHGVHPIPMTRHVLAPSHDPTAPPRSPACSTSPRSSHLA